MSEGTSRRVVAKIEFHFDEDNIREFMSEDPCAAAMSQQDLLDYAKQTMFEDISNLYKHDELYQAIHAEIVEGPPQ
jgi:hypothetical protein